MKHFFAAILFLYITHGTAQLVSPENSVLLDSNNVRLHLARFDLLLSQAENEIWNPRTLRYECPLPEMLTSQLLVRPPFTHLQVFQKAKSRQYHYPDWQRKHIDTLGRSLSREAFDSSSITDLIDLRYDTEGRLIRLTRQHLASEDVRDLINCDTFKISYEAVDSGRLRIQVKNVHFQSGKSGFYSSVYFKQDFSKAPLQLIETRDFSYLIGAHKELLEHGYRYEVKANGIIGNWKGDHIRTFRRDSLGRLLVVKDSLTQVQLPFLTQAYLYETIPLDSHRFWAFHPQIQRWLKHYPGSCIVRRLSSERWFSEEVGDTIRLLPKTIRQEDTVYYMQDRYGQIVAALPASASDRYIHLRQDCTDSLGQHFGWYKVAWEGDKTDTALYQPGTTGDPVTLKMGCVVETHFERPKGTLPLSYAATVSRRSTRLKDHSRLLEYGRSAGGGDHDYWSPVSQRYHADSAPAFLLTTPDGRLRFFQDEDNLFQINYLP